MLHNNTECKRFDRMIIDCHGHYTTAPPALGEYREQQKADLKRDAAHEAVKGVISISDD